MISLSLADIARITGGNLHGDPDVPVNAPAAVDSRDIAGGGLFVALAGEHVDGHDFVAQAMAAGAAAVLASRPVDAPAVIVDDVLAALAALARETTTRLKRDYGCIIVGVTGSQGKTSVKDLLAQVLAVAGPTIAAKGSFNNELGVPLTILAADELTKYLIVEMGARGQGHIDRLCTIAQPDIGVVLNVGTAHVGEFGSTEHIAAAKGELVAALGAAGTAVLNADDPAVAAMRERTTANVITFGASGDVLLSDVRVDDGGCPSFTLAYGDDSVDVSLAVLGYHQALNAAAVAAVGVSVGMSLGAICQALGAARALSAMRMERSITADGVIVINDAYNANPESMSAALRTLGRLGQGHGTYAVLGEMLELGETSADAHAAIGALAARLGITHVVVVGDGAAPIEAGVRGARTPTAVTRVADVAAASELLKRLLKPGDVALIKASRAGGLERVAAALLA
ncbi:MAG: UDP-N-acetylmuramoyl-tripeptide--D-alanyl-D-alanine ligase [Propionibacteriales bacterium]|nr:UDP-N-acetylmuramoyl-tripeptide--D-alanyl-D-alanine ligase [Propionibacteriales bacterium]